MSGLLPKAYLQMNLRGKKHARLTGQGARTTKTARDRRKRVGDRRKRAGGAIDCRLAGRLAGQEKLPCTVILCVSLTID